jgi:nitrate/TMAO reductase-like tetraheme cytochrome c subunit
MADFESFRKNWIRPFFFYGNNRLSLIGGALTSASALVLIGFWVVDVLGHAGSNNPYIGIIVDFALPALFVLGLVMIAVGLLIRQRGLKAAGEIPSVFPAINMSDPVFRHGIEFVAIATAINFVIVGTAAYRGVAYMDTPSFCGQACHVMDPEFQAYHMASHRGVPCTDCHIAPGVGGFVHAKMNGTKQLALVLLHKWPTPIMADNKVPAANLTCLNCHNPDRNIGDRIHIDNTFGDDEKNSLTHTVAVMHVGGGNVLGQWTGIHGAHSAHIEYIATDNAAQTIPYVALTNPDGSVTEFLSSDAKGTPAGNRHTMDCIDCHNRAAHSFDTAQQALDRYMTAGTPNAALPFIHKQGMALLKTEYRTQEDAQTGITKGLEQFYSAQYPQVYASQRPQVEAAAKALTSIYDHNIFPAMKVTWGTHPNNLGHNDYPGCFRCHDGSHTSKSGKTITNDCATCHNLAATDEANPKALADLGIPQ